ncbi:MAG: nitroreductase family protein [Deltaproteobacteria bacterium]|nr:nitroreductase family protein [Deltaproteobacteria bacterium]
MLKWLRNFAALFTGKPAAALLHELPETIRLLFARRSCRSFNDEPLLDEEIHAILEAGRFAPSTVNLQTWTFITFTRQQWHGTFDRPIPFKGCYAIIICADIFRLKNFLPDLQETPFVNLSLGIFNAGLAAMSMTMAAEAFGISSIMLSETGRAGLLDCAFLKEKLALPESVLPLTTLVLGRGGRRLPGIPPRQPREAVIMPAAYDRQASSHLGSWYEQMFIGYKLTHPLSSFEKQIAHYRTKMVQAEVVIRDIFLAGRKSRG